MRRGRREICVHPYRISQKMLTVGDGDFTFSACLAKAFGSAHNMVVTSQDSLDAKKSKYEYFEKEWNELKNRGCSVLFDVDVHDMNAHPILSAMKFDVIVFNFPHAGYNYGLSEANPIVIERHKKLVRGFFRSAREMLKKGGDVHIAHRDDEPYCRWELDKQALVEGFVLEEKSLISKIHYPGYHKKTGSVIQGDNLLSFAPQPFRFKFRVSDGSCKMIKSRPRPETLQVSRFYPRSYDKFSGKVDPEETVEKINPDFFCSSNLFHHDDYYSSEDDTCSNTRVYSEIDQAIDEQAFEFLKRFTRRSRRSRLGSKFWLGVYYDIYAPVYHNQ